MSDWQLRLRLKTRDTRGVKSNLFARISFGVVKLLSDYLLTLPNLDSSVSDSGCNILDYLESEQDNLLVEFLPLRITFSDGTIIYVSYNGGSINENDTIELPISAIPNDCNDEIVNVKPLTFIRDAHEIVVEPISTEDWELLEIYSNYLEDGGILNQVSVVYPGQVLTLSVGSEQNYARVIVSEELENCSRLLSDTKIVVVPKPRPGQFRTSQSFRLLATNDDWSNDMKLLANNWDIQLLTVSQNSVLINPKTLESQVPGWGDGISHAIIWREDLQPSERSLSLVVIESSHDIIENHVALSSTNRYSIKATPLLHYVRIQLISSDDIYRIRRRTVKQLEEGEVGISVARVKVVTAEEEWKMWRYNESCHLKPSIQTLCATPCDRDVLLTDGSFMINESLGCVCKIALKGLDYPLDDKDEWSPFPEFLLSMQDICKLPITDSFDKVFNHIEIGLTLMPTTPHVPRNCQMNTVKKLKATWKSNDAWIVEGDTGSGRTHCCIIFASIMRMKWFMPTFYLDCKMLQAGPDSKMHSILRELTSIFKEALTVEPSILILDDFDHLVPNFNSDSSNNSTGIIEENPIAIDQSRLLANHFQNLVALCQSKLVLVISCKSSSSINSEVFESFTCFESCTIETLSEEERIRMIKSMLHEDFTIPPHLISLHSEGYRAQDLKILITRAQACLPIGEKDAKQTIIELVDNYVPLSRQGLPPSESAGTQEWNDVGGIFKAKKQLRSLIVDPIKYRRIYESAPINLPKGILLFGPPGCGKSFIIPALARECKHTLITCRGPELLDRYIGASEANVRKLFDQARCAAPSILFLDEFDSLAPRRGTDHTGVTDRVVNQLLTFLDGVETNLNDIFIIAGTSRPDKVDPALLRPGRLERHVHIGFPESLSEIYDVILKIISKRQVSQDLIKTVESGSLCKTQEEEELLKLLSPADIRAVADTAHLEAIDEIIESECLDQSNVTISLQHFRSALLSTRPSISKQDRKIFNRAGEQFMPPSRGKRSYEKKLTFSEPKVSLK